MTFTKGQQEVFMEFTIEEEFAAQAIGAEVLKHLKQTWTPQMLVQEAENRAVKVLEDILRVLDNDALDDPECFRRIQAILNVLEENDIYSTRHDV